MARAKLNLTLSQASEPEKKMKRLWNHLKLFSWGKLDISSLYGETRRILRDMTLEFLEMNRKQRALLSTPPSEGDNDSEEGNEVLWIDTSSEGR